MKRPFWIALSTGALLTLFLVTVALAQPPAPTQPTTPPVPPAGGWETMRDWMDSQYGAGFFDGMHGSYEGMTQACNTMMSSGGMMEGAGMMGSGGMMRQSGNASRTGLGAMMGSLMGEFGSRMRALSY